MIALLNYLENGSYDSYALMCRVSYLLRHLWLNHTGFECNYHRPVIQVVGDHIISAAYAQSSSKHFTTF